MHRVVSKQTTQRAT